MIVEGMAGSNLIEMYGNDPEMMGFSIGKTFRKATGVVKRNAGTIATGGLSLMAPKSVQKTLNRGVLTATKYGTAAATGGTSLLVTKDGRNTIGKAARFTQKKILRPTAGGVMTVGRNPLVQKAAQAAARAGAAYVTGGASEAALLAARNLKGRPASGGIASAFAARTAPAASVDWADRLKRAGRAAVDQVLPPDAPPAAAPGAGLPMPLIIGGVAALGLVGLMFAMKGGKK